MKYPRVVRVSLKTFIKLLYVGPSYDHHLFGRVYQVGSEEVRQVSK